MLVVTRYLVISFIDKPPQRTCSAEHKAEHKIYLPRKDRRLS